MSDEIDRAIIPCGYYWAILADNGGEREIISVDSDGEIRRTGSDYPWNINDREWQIIDDALPMPDRPEPWSAE